MDIVANVLTRNPGGVKWRRESMVWLGDCLAIVGGSLRLLS